MKLYILNCGYLLPKYKELLAQPEDGEKPCKLPIAPVLIKTEEHNILFDTGSYSNSEGWPYDPFSKYPDFPLYIKEGERLEEQLALCGITPEDVDIVVLSHPHFDHIGGLDLFPHAKLYVPTDRDPRLDGRACHVIEEDCALFPGIELIQLPGHTEAQLGMLVRLENAGVMIFPQDCAHIGEIYGPPVKRPAEGLMENAEQYFASIERVRALEERYHAKVVLAHDEPTLSAMRHAPAYYD